MTRLLITLVHALAILLSTGHASAFSDTAKFAAPTLVGGGGGRFFTGSPRDGYSCTVCHGGGATPNVSVLGLPETGFQPATTYDISVVFDQPELSHAMALEFVTESGTQAGTVSFPPDAEADPAGHCNGDLTLPFAPYLMPIKGRTIVGLADCGARRLRFLFTAPDEPRVAFALGMVASNAQADAFGDGSLGITRVLTRVGEGAAERAPPSACDVRMHRAAAGDSWSWPLWVVVMITVARNRTARRRTARHRTAHRLVCLAMAVSVLSACARVAPYERGTLARRDMELGENADLSAGEEHAEAYREGSSGGGAAKGGGCGCN